MKERPIRMTAPEVRALLDGTKTQTRRAVKPRNGGTILGWGGPGIAMENLGTIDGCMHVETVLCPYGQPGDRLWVRETWKYGVAAYDLQNVEVAQYQATPGVNDNADQEVHMAQWEDRWRPSIHMPRWASRITIKITSVRVERLQDISEADAFAEGVYDGTPCRCDEPLDFVRSCGNCGGRLVNAIYLYRTLWESLNGPGSWDANPWVWVVEFERVTS
ncbi:MAG: hypothetical protein WBG17_14055 [Burkholderiaceae bacterium]